MGTFTLDLMLVYSLVRTARRLVQRVQGKTYHVPWGALLGGCLAVVLVGGTLLVGSCVVAGFLLARALS